jgi:hypothetical protein
MKTSKAILLGILFSFFGFVIYGFVSIVRSGLHIERNHAVGIGALLGGTGIQPIFLDRDFDRFRRCVLDGATNHLRYILPK